MKTGLIVEGGGMKCAYGAGVLDILLDNDVNFDYCIGVSAGAANAASFLAGQRDRNKRFYTIHVTDPNYLSVYSLLKTGSLFGLRYIYGDMTNEGGIDPLDYDAYMANPTEAYFPATDAVTGEANYFNKNELRRNEYEPIMATCSLPVACKPIEYEGHVYYDGGVADSIPIEHALEHGCDRIVFISSKPEDFRMPPQTGKMLYTMTLKRKYPGVVEGLNHRHEVYNKQLDKVKALEAEGKVMCFHPSADIKIGTFTKDPAVMMQLYDNGVEDTIKNINRLKDFLNGK
ncbi:MAG: patatin family protein [Lachnospiraceae bacterium]|nr:patatin family protein [Lachnospiraceae bacterium]